MIFTLKPQDLRLLDADLNWLVEPGLFEVMVGDRKAAFEVINHQTRRH